MFLNIGRHLKFVRIGSIVCLQASGGESRIHLENGYEGLVFQSITEWEEILPKNKFCHICDPFIINTDYIIKIHETMDNCYLVYMQYMAEPLKIEKKNLSRSNIAPDQYKNNR